MNERYMSWSFSITIQSGNVDNKTWRWFLQQWVYSLVTGWCLYSGVIHSSIGCGQLIYLECLHHPFTQWTKYLSQPGGGVLSGKVPIRLIGKTKTNPLKALWESNLVFKQPPFSLHWCLAIDPYLSFFLLIFITNPFYSMIWQKNPYF